MLVRVATLRPGEEFQTEGGYTRGRVLDEACEVGYVAVSLIGSAIEEPGRKLLRAGTLVQKIQAERGH